MPNSYYSPNAKITGGALFASFNSKDGSVYLKLLKQIANNPDKKGNFDGQNPIHVKLSQDEIADIIRVVRTSSQSSFFHKFKDDTTTGRFNYYEIDGKDKEGKPTKRKGFGLSVKKNDVEIKVNFGLGSAERLSLFLQNSLTHIFNAEYSQDLKEAKEYRDKQDKKPTATEQESPQTENGPDNDGWPAD